MIRLTKCGGCVAPGVVLLNPDDVMTIEQAIYGSEVIVVRAGQLLQYEVEETPDQIADLIGLWKHRPSYQGDGVTPFFSSIKVHKSNDDESCFAFTNCDGDLEFPS